MKQLDILIVDDDVDLCYLIRASLKDKHLVYVLHTLHHARAYLANHRVHLILLDNGLPDGIGIDFLQELRKSQSGAKVVMISADPPELTKKKALDAGAYYFMAKPFAVDSIEKLLPSIFPEFLTDVA